MKQEWKQYQLWLCVANSNKETSKKEKIIHKKGTNGNKIFY